MTDHETRVQELERKYHNIDKRQESFETFVRANIAHIQAQTDRLDARMDKLEGKIDNLMVAGGIGLATILAGMVAMVAALK